MRPIGIDHLPGGKGIDGAVKGLVAATGHRVETRGMQMSRLADGKIVERWGALDDLAILGRLNVSVPS